MNVREIALKARKAEEKLAIASTDEKNLALKEIGRQLLKERKKILKANEKDIVLAEKNGKSKAFIDRLKLNNKRIREIASQLKEVIALKDPVGTTAEKWKKRGLLIKKVRVPLGVIGIIYEARPNVTVDASALCLKSGNAVILRGSSDAFNSNKAIVRAMQSALKRAGLPRAAIQLLGTDRRDVNQLLKLHGLVDAVIPRGSAALINFVVSNASVPVIETGEGVCHTFVDESADLKQAVKIAINAKTQRPSVCNAMECMLVHRKIAKAFLPKAVGALQGKGVEIRGCEATKKIVPGVRKAAKSDFGKEFLDLVLAVKVVRDVDEAIEHINRFGTKHSDAILSKSKMNITEFFKRVDSACVYSNASTRFTDGNQFGLGMEIGISTQKLHARGPMSLRELASTKFVIEGKGQVRK